MIRLRIKRSEKNKRLRLQNSMPHIFKKRHFYPKPRYFTRINIPGASFRAEYAGTTKIGQSTSVRVKVSNLPILKMPKWAIYKKGKLFYIPIDPKYCVNKTIKTL